MKRPSFQFYPADWLNDVNTRRASYELKGFLLDLMCLMHQSEKYGFLTKDLEKDLPVLLGKDRRTLGRLLTDLQAKSLISRDTNTGELFNKRMVKDNEIMKLRKAAGELGGNPNLLKQKVKQKTTPSSSTSISSSSSTSDGEQPPLQKKERIELTESDKEKFKEFSDMCSSYSIRNDVTASQYTLLRSEYESRLLWWVEAKGCVQWLFDKKFEVVNAARLRNRMKNCLKFNREKILKQETAYQDKKAVAVTPYFIPHYDKPWTPPI